METILTIIANLLFFSFNVCVIADMICVIRQEKEIKELIKQYKMLNKKLSQGENKYEKRTSK